MVPETPVHAVLHDAGLRRKLLRLRARDAFRSQIHEWELADDGERELVAAVVESCLATWHADEAPLYFRTLGWSLRAGAAACFAALFDDVDEDLANIISARAASEGYAGLVTRPVRAWFSAPHDDPCLGTLVPHPMLSGYGRMLAIDEGQTPADAPVRVVPWHWAREFLGDPVPALVASRLDAAAMAWTNEHGPASLPPRLPPEAPESEMNLVLRESVPSLGRLLRAQQAIRESLGSGSVRSALAAVAEARNELDRLAALAVGMDALSSSPV